jgi:2-keto-4-pentenoate hydratase/2-oxohepta-3-ene-1,7-dioic acid hydratase in catechol pathway
VIGEGELPRLGPVFVTQDEVPKPNALRIRTVIDGFVRQDWGTGDMIRDVPALSAFPSSRRILLPGTPHGVGFARNPPVRRQPGGTVTSDFGRIGTPMNRVVAEAT